MLLRVDSVAAVRHHGIEAVVVVGRVVDRSLGAVGLQKGVLALDHVAVALLVGVLIVPGVRVLDSVFVRVFRVGLENEGKIVSQE